MGYFSPLSQSASFIYAPRNHSSESRPVFWWSVFLSDINSLYGLYLRTITNHITKLQTIWTSNFKHNYRRFETDNIKHETAQNETVFIFAPVPFQASGHKRSRPPSRKVGPDANFRRGRESPSLAVLRNYRKTRLNTQA